LTAEIAEHAEVCWFRLTAEIAGHAEVRWFRLTAEIAGHAEVRWSPVDRGDRGARGVSHRAARLWLHSTSRTLLDVDKRSARATWDSAVDVDNW